MKPTRVPAATLALSALLPSSNIDIEIGDGNQGAVAIRGTYAQHCFLAHMDFQLGSAIAGVHDTGNVMEDVRFFGGQYGIWTRIPSPGWQFTAVDAYFEGQTEAAIRETMAGLTLVRPSFKNVPTAISIDAGSYDELWIKDGRMENISGPAVIVSLEDNPRTEINIENVVCRRVPTFARLRDSGKTFTAPGEIYEGADLLRAFGLASGQPGQPFYVTSEADVTTWRGTLGPDGNFTDFKPFVQQGGEGVAVDAQGNVYLAAGHIYVYNRSGTLIDTIETPERPTQLVFGGRDGRTLFITARNSLYGVRTRVRGR